MSDAGSRHPVDGGLRERDHFGCRDRYGECTSGGKTLSLTMQWCRPEEADWTWSIFAKHEQLKPDRPDDASDTERRRSYEDHRAPGRRGKVEVPARRVVSLSCEAGAVVVHFADGGSVDLVWHDRLVIGPRTRARIQQILGTTAPSPAVIERAEHELDHLDVVELQGDLDVKLEAWVAAARAKRFLDAGELEKADAVLTDLVSNRISSHNELTEVRLPPNPKALAVAIAARRKALRPFVVLRRVRLPQLDALESGEDQGPVPPDELSERAFWSGRRFCVAEQWSDDRHAWQMPCYDVDSGTWQTTWRGQLEKDTDVRLTDRQKPPKGACLGAACKLVVVKNRLRWRDDDRVTWNLLPPDDLRQFASRTARAWLPSPGRDWVLAQDNDGYFLAQVQVKGAPPAGRRTSPGGGPTAHPVAKAAGKPSAEVTRCRLGPAGVPVFLKVAPSAGPNGRPPVWFVYRHVPSPDLPHPTSWDWVSTDGSTDWWSGRKWECRNGVGSSQPSVYGALAGPSDHSEADALAVTCTGGSIELRYAVGPSIALRFEPGDQYLSIDPQTRARAEQLLAVQRPSSAIVDERRRLARRIDVVAPCSELSRKLDRRADLDLVDPLLAADELDAADAVLEGQRIGRWTAPPLVPMTTGEPLYAGPRNWWRRRECEKDKRRRPLHREARPFVSAVAARRKALRPFVVVRKVWLPRFDDLDRDWPWESSVALQGVVWMGRRFCFADPAPHTERGAAYWLRCYDVGTGRWSRVRRKQDPWSLPGQRLDDKERPPPGACLGSACALVIDKQRRIQWKGDYRISWDLVPEGAPRPERGKFPDAQVRAWLPSPDRHWVLADDCGRWFLAKVRVTRKHPPPRHPKK